MEKILDFEKHKALKAKKEKLRQLIEGSGGDNLKQAMMETIVNWFDFYFEDYENLRHKTEQAYRIRQSDELTADLKDKYIALFDRMGRLTVIFEAIDALYTEGESWELMTRTSRAKKDNTDYRK